MSQKDIDSLHLDTAELRSLLEAAKRPKVKDFLSIQLRKVETELIKIRDELEANKKVDTASAKPNGTSANNQKACDVQVKTYSWDQSDKFVKIYLTGIKNVQNIPLQDIKTEFKDSSVKVRIENLEGKNHNFEVKETCQPYNAEKSYVKVKTDMVSIFLSKNDSSKWSHLKLSDAKSEKTKKKEWDVEKDESEEPTNHLMKFMKKMYEEGDDEIKRKIAQTWTESQELRARPDREGVPEKYIYGKP